MTCGLYFSPAWITWMPEPSIVGAVSCGVVMATWWPAARSADANGTSGKKCDGAGQQMMRTRMLVRSVESQHADELVDAPDERRRFRPARVAFGDSARGIRVGRIAEQRRQRAQH